MAVAIKPAAQRRILPYVLALLLIGTAAILAWRGWSFYKLGLEERPRWRLTVAAADDTRAVVGGHDPTR